jgi:endonuclease/exonuclease/phosphatase family metal-dependent hydrolase
MRNFPEQAGPLKRSGDRPLRRRWVVPQSALLVVAVCAAARGQSTPAAGAAASVSTPLNVITWNIKINDNSESHARAAMDLLAATTPQPEVVVIQEAYQQWFSTYIDELQRKTGRTWHGVFATHCAPGNWTGSACSTAWYQGIGIFTTHTITGTSSTLLPYSDCWTSARAGLRAAIDLNGSTVQIFTTHLQTGGCSNDAQARYNSMTQLKSWAGNYSRPQIVAGDFNADMNQIDTTLGMLPDFVDSWATIGSGRGFSAFTPTPTMKLDYWFSDAGGGAVPTSTAVVSSTGTTSDHCPLRATFVVQTAGGSLPAVTGLRFVAGMVSEPRHDRDLAGMLAISPSREND